MSQFNWIDAIIILLISYSLYQGWKAGFVRIGISFVAFALSLWVAILYNAQLSYFFTEKFGMPTSWGTILAYIVISMGGQLSISYLLSFAVSRLSAKIEKSIINSVTGLLVSGVNNLTTIAFFLIIILALPLKGTVQQDIRTSLIGRKIVSFVETYGGPITKTAKEIKKTAARFVTVSPGSTSSMPLDVIVSLEDISIDDQKERELLALVNKERSKLGIKPLTVDVKLVTVARNHSKDMFLNKYFSHISPDGKTLGDRMKKEDVRYSNLGENIAYTPDVETAHDGLMNSPEHKKNILDPGFLHIGIGIISASRYGIMVTQNFAN